MALQPEVSIIIPVHGNWRLTAQCLASIAEHISAVGYEVIVVDDASVDETPQKLGEVVGIHVVRLRRNVGFVSAVNAGIEVARGRYVLLLNNDTQVQVGWLDALVSTVETANDVGVVGAKLVYPDGRLQEAGGIIWSDGSGHNYGRNQDPNDPRFNFVRDVDYCSGACLLVRSELLRRLGGLDGRFSPAYYEDTDLCFAARSLGYRVVYQPAAVVHHHEGATNGTDVTTGLKRYQVVNQERFREKWATELMHQPGANLEKVREASWRSVAGRLVVVDHQIPMPDHDSGSRRMTELLAILAGLGYGVTFAPQNAVVIPEYQRSLQSRGIEVLDGPPELDRYLQELGDGIRAAILSRPTVAWQNLPMFRSLVPRAKIIYDTVDLHYLREERRAEFESTGDARFSARFHHDMELALAALCDATWVVSDVEREALRREDSSLQVEIIPNVHASQPPGPPFEYRDGLLFVGNFAHRPNRDAAEWLATDIFPILRQRMPDIQLYLVGSNTDEAIRNLAKPGIHVLGWVPDLTDLYNRTRIFLAPLRFGAGLKGKIGESLSFGLPVVTTGIGAEGLGLTHGHDVLLGDAPDTFAEAVSGLYQDSRLWTDLAQNGREAMKQFAPSSVATRVAAALGLAAPTVKGSLLP